MAKGMVEVQFNWIFVLVAGAVILAFFFTIVQKQRQIAEQKLTFTLINDLETIATGAQVSRGTAQSIDMPKVGIEFECFPDCGPGALACEYRIESQHQDYKDKFIFAPSRIEGRKLLLWTADWKLPFRIANFLYVTNNQIHYVLVVDPTKPSSAALRDRILKLLPEEVVVDTVPLGSIGEVRSENYQRTRFVLLDTAIQENGIIELHSSFKGAEVSAVELHTGGKVRFHNLANKKQTSLAAAESFYLGDEMLFAAFFSENVLMYECNMKNAFYRMIYSLGLYAERAQALQEESANNPDLKGKCIYRKDLLTQMQEQARALSLDMRSLENGVPRIQILRQRTEDLKRHNDQLVGQSCPPLY